MWKITKSGALKAINLTLSCDVRYISDEIVARACGNSWAVKYCICFHLETCFTKLPFLVAAVDVDRVLPISAKGCFERLTLH